MNQHGLTVIQGGAAARSPWLDLPATVVAPSHLDRTGRCSYRVAREDVVKAALRAGKRQGVLQFWSIIRGIAPPVPNIGIGQPGLPNHGLSSLLDAHACFKGVRRPLAEDDAGAQCVAYVIKPRFVYVYRPTPEHGMVCPILKEPVPDGHVFMAYVRLDEPITPAVPNINGVLTHWHFVESDPSDESLPIDHTTRYDQRLW